MNRHFGGLIILLMAIIPLYCVQGQTIMAAWGDSNLLGFHDVGAPTVWTPRIFSHTYWGTSLDRIRLIASNDYATLGVHSEGGFVGWGAISQYWKAPRTMEFHDPPAWLDDPLAQLIGAGHFWMGITESGVVYSWSYLARDLACPVDWQVFGRLERYQDCSLDALDAEILPLSFNTSEPILQVGCQASYCVAMSQSTVHFWGVDNSQSFNFPGLTAPSTSPVPFDLYQIVPSGFQFSLLAVARRSEPGDWFFVVGRNASHSAVIFSTGRSNGVDLEDARFMPSSTLGTAYQLFYESTALPFDFEPSWAAAGLRHGVIASSSEIFVWGANDYLQLGLSTDPLEYTATPISLTSGFPMGTLFAGLSVHRSTTYVLTASGGLFVFGPSRVCEDYRCREMDAALYGQTFIEQTRPYNPGPVAIPLPIVAAHPPVFTKRPQFTDTRGQDYYYGTAFHVLGTVLDSDREVVGAAPDQAIVGWGMSSNAPEDATYTMPYGIDVGNFTTSAQRLDLQKPTLVALPPGVTAIHSLSSILHSVGAVVELDGKLVPYIWGGMAHYEGPSTPYKFETSHYEPEPANTYSTPVDLTPKLKGPMGSEPEIEKMVWGYEGLVVQYANGTVSYSDYDPGEWHDVAYETLPADKLGCSRLGCGYLRDTNGSLTMWSMDELFTDPCYFLGYGDICTTTPRIVPLASPVLDFGLWGLMGVLLLDQPSDCIVTAGSEAYDAPYLGTEQNMHTTYLPINFTHLGYNFAGGAVRAMSVGYGYSMFIINDDTPWIFGFGSNHHGQIMGRGYEATLLPTRLPSDWIDLSVHDPMDISCVGETTFLLTATPEGIQMVFVWGFNGLGQMFGEGHAGTFDTRLESSPHLFQLPDSLGADYTIKSIIKSPDASTVFAIVTTSGPLAKFSPPNVSVPNQRIQAIGTDIFEEAAVERFPRMLSQYYGAPTRGSELSRGQILPNETIVKVSAGLMTTWYLTDQNRLYATGRTACLPFISNTANFDEFKAIQWEPHLFLDLSSDTVSITDIATHDASVVFILSNRTVGYFIASDRYNCPSEVLGDPFLMDEAVPHFLPTDYDSINCRPQTCCFLDEVNDVLDCFGQENGASPSASSSIISTSPILSISGMGIRNFYLGVDCVVYIDASNVWTRNASESAITSPIPGLEGRTILQVGQANRHMIINTDIGMFTLAHSYESLYGHVNISSITINSFVRFQPTYTNVQQVAAWGLMSFWMAIDGTVWYAGLDLFATEAFWPALNAPVTPYVPGPRSLPVPDGFTIDSIFSRMSYVDTVQASNRIIAVTLKSTSQKPSTSTSPSPTPTTVPSGISCKGNTPFAGCQCNTIGVWSCSGSKVVNTSSPVTVNNQITIDGDLVVSDPDVLIINVGELESDNFGKPLIVVSGCVVLLKPISLELNEKAVKAVPSGTEGQELQLIESSCSQAANTELLKVIQKDRLCQKISNQPMESVNGSGKTGISVVFRVQTNSCNYWWIILASVLGATLVSITLILLIFTKTGVLRQIIQPYRGTNT